MAFGSVSFTGSDGSTIQSVDSNVTKIGNGTNILINTNRGYASASATWSMYYYNAAQAASADYDVQCTIGRTTKDTAGPAGRLSTNGNDGYFVKFMAATGWQLYQRSGGSASQIGSTYNGDDPYTAARVGLLRMVGTDISFLVDGVLRIGPATGAVTAKGYAGFGTYYSGSYTGCYIDDWSAIDAAAGLIVNPLSGRGAGAAQPIWSGA